jgi:hypothetical protein
MNDHLERRIELLCAKPTRGASGGLDLSPVRERGCVRFVDFHHLFDGEGQTVGNCGDVIDFIEGQRATFARLQVFVEHLITAYVELPNGWR